MTPAEILEKIYHQAVMNGKRRLLTKNQSAIAKQLDTIIAKIDQQKSQVSALVTSCLKKICDPKQDIRYHRVDFIGGYSARVLDTRVTTPFFKKHFPRYAHKESAFISMSTREKIPWTMIEGMELKIRNQAIKESFLEIIDAVEKGEVSPNKIIAYLFLKLDDLSRQYRIILDETIDSSDSLGVVNINTVLTMLDRHFALKLSSRLPVIAVYSAYDLLLTQVNRYVGKQLRPLNVHKASDKHGYGDIEVWNDDDTPFEIVEIKHNIKIDRNLIFDVVKKTEDSDIKRYYVLTTAKDNFPSSEEEEYINKLILKIRNQTGMDIIANGILYSLKYYLRFIEDCREFIKSYTQNLEEDAMKSTEVQGFQITAWRDILREHELD